MSKGFEKVVFAPNYSPCLEEIVMPYTSHKERLKQWLSEQKGD